jgi:NADH-quinone oxidoreductase subunit H
VLRHLTLDVRPSAAPADAERDREGTRLLTWVGVEAVAGPSGLAVRSVEPGSRADSAGISAGDVMVTFDGVRVASAGDVLPPAGERQALVVVRRPGAEGEATRTVAVDGFRRSPPSDLVGEALVVLSALALVLLLGAPPWSPLASAVQRMVSRARTRSGRAFRAVLAEALPPPGTPAAVDAVACALLAAMPFGQYLVASQLDVGLLFLAAATSLAMVALLSHRSAWGGVKAAAHVALQHFPAAVAVVAVVATTGSLRVQEIERAQGGWPWDWLAFRSPGALVACALVLACARIEPDAPDRASGVAALVEDSSDARPRGPWLAAACRAHRLLVAGLAATLFLGGWLLPGLTAAQQDAHPALEVAGAVWLLAKTAALVVLMSWSRLVLPRRRLVERTQTTALWLAPISLAALVAAASWTWWSPAPAAQLLVSGALVALVTLAAFALVHRFRHGMLSSAGDGRLSPFL